MVETILSPSKFIYCYYLVTGEHGTGKTSIVQQAALAIQEKAKRNKEPTGIIYVDVNTPLLLEMTLASALNFRFQEKINFFSHLQQKILGESPHSESSQWLRGQILEIGDFEKTEARDYFVKTLGFPETIATSVVEIVGGRLLLLQQYAAKLKEGETFEGITEELFTRVNDDFLHAITVESPEQKQVVLKLITTL
ncbi:P-loop containing nucleoside triphosphate hydrolase protein [Balamuthia mandrillaris]